MDTGVELIWRAVAGGGASGGLGYLIITMLLVALLRGQLYTREYVLKIEGERDEYKRLALGRLADLEREQVAVRARIAGVAAPGAP